MQAPRILIVDDQLAIREELAFALDYEGFRTAEAADGEAALAQIDQGDVAVVLLDIKMPGEDGLQVLGRVKARCPDLPVVMISGHGDIETAVVAVKNGAYDFLTKPFDTDRVLVSIKNALQLANLASENQALKVELARDYQLLGKSGGVDQVRSMITRVAPTEAQVLITGESGTGKELVARQIHAQSKRNRGAFVALNCAAIPSELVESELFGHEKGAFTGANQARAGHFETASGGTLFLDEIGDLALDAQAKLLRGLQENVVTRVGSTRPIQVDVRVVAATNQDLPTLVEERKFREDLYYRLHVIRIHMPPLRDRAEDIELLATHFLQQASRRNGLPDRKLSPSALEHLRSLTWPGNVRQLKNLLEAAAILAEGPEIMKPDLVLTAAPEHSSASGPDWFATQTLEEFKATVEKEFIRRKLEDNGGNIKRTAERIQIQRSNLYKKLERYNLK
jgi:two-component system nitrogen regulation response regulator NtrX